MPTHILGNGLYRLRDKINNLKQEYLPTAFRFFGVILDIRFDTGLFNNLVQQNLRPDCVVTRIVSNPIGSNAEAYDSFTYRASMQESVSLTIDTLQTHLVERFNELSVSTHTTSQVGGEAGVSLFGIINIGGSVGHTSNQTTHSTNQNRTRETNLTRNGKTVLISSNTSYEINNTLVANPGANLKQTWFVNVVRDLSIPFEAKLLVRAKRASNGDTCSKDVIQDLLLMGYGVESIEITAGTDATSLFCKIKGSMNMSLGLDIVNNITNQ
jgi:hypothetical protein